MRADRSYDEARAIFAALPGYWRIMVDRSGDLFEIERDGRREVKTVWIDAAGGVVEIQPAELKRSGRVFSVAGRRMIEAEERY